MLEEVSGLTRGRRLPLSSSRPSACSPAASSRTSASTPSSSADSRAEGANGPRDFYEAVLDFDDRPDLERGNGVWDLGSAEAAEMAKLAETTYRDVNIGLANQFAQVRRDGRHRRLPGHRGLELPALQPHPPARHLRRRSLHPGLSPALPLQRPRRDGRPRRTRGQRRDARARGRPARRSIRRPHWAHVSSSWARPTAAA